MVWWILDRLQELLVAHWATSQWVIGKYVFFKEKKNDLNNWLHVRFVYRFKLLPENYSNDKSDMSIG